VRRACIYGVAGPTPDEIAQSDATSLVALTQRIGADSLGFLDRDALADPSGVVRCEGCFGGDWPVPVETDDQLPLFGG
jgi:glutamine phosphoribosylpyrophosphate amidotransferase